jgi:hypothetical protein
MQLNAFIDYNRSNLVFYPPLCFELCELCGEKSDPAIPPQSCSPLRTQRTRRLELGPALVFCVWSRQNKQKKKAVIEESDGSGVSRIGSVSSVLSVVKNPIRRNCSRPQLLFHRRIFTTKDTKDTKVGAWSCAVYLGVVATKQTKKESGGLRKAVDRLCALAPL